MYQIAKAVSNLQWLFSMKKETLQLQIVSLGILTPIVVSINDIVQPFCWVIGSEKVARRLVETVDRKSIYAISKNLFMSISLLNNLLLAI